MTLIETVIVIGLVVAAIGAVVVMYSSFNSLYGFGQISIANDTAARSIMAEAEAMVVPASLVLSSRTFGTGTYLSTSTSLVTQLPSIDGSGGFINGKYDYIALYTSTSTGKAYRRVEADAGSARKTGTKQLSDTPATLSLSYNSATFSAVSSVTLTVMVSSTVKTTVLDNELTSTFMLRNHN